jgi:hypothetical protein
MKTTPPLKTTRSPADTLLLRGSLITLRRRCGKPACHCAQGHPHCSPALSFSQQGKTKILTLTPDRLAAVRAALQRYRQAQRALEQQANAGLRQLTRTLQSARQSTRH